MRTKHRIHKVVEIHRALADIRMALAAGDPEDARSMECDLYVSTLRAVAQGADNSKALARAALRVADMDFPKVTKVSDSLRQALLGEEHHILYEQSSEFRQAVDALVAILPFWIEGLARGAERIGHLAKRAAQEMSNLLDKGPPGWPCTAIIAHGPGHQSVSRCTVLGEHDEHEAAPMGVVLRWTGNEASTGYFDESPK